MLSLLSGRIGRLPLGAWPPGLGRRDLCTAIHASGLDLFLLDLPYRVIDLQKAP